MCTSYLWLGIFLCVGTAVTATERTFDSKLIPLLYQNNAPLEREARATDLVAPEDFHNWQRLVSPFFRLLPDVRDFCSCTSFGNCGCCLGFKTKPITIKNNICVNATLGRDRLYKSQELLRVKVHYDSNIKLLDFTVSEKEPPTVCVPLIPFTTVQGCVHLASNYLDRKEGKGCSCVAASLHLRDRSPALFTLPQSCLCVGRVVPPSEKRGIFQILAIGNLFNAGTDLIGTALKTISKFTGLPDITRFTGLLG